MISEINKQKWEEKTIKQLTTLICDGDWIESKNQSSSGIRLIQTGNVGDGYYKDKPENARYISEDTFKKLNCTEIYPGDCLVSRLPEPLGRACLIPDRKERMITAVDCSIIRFNDKLIVPKYFIYYSMSNLYHTKIINLSTGATRQRISRKNLETITIPVPKIEEQQRIVEILDEAFENIEKAKQNTLQNLNNAKELFESYLENIFKKTHDNWQSLKISDISLLKQSKEEVRIFDENEIVSFVPMEYLGINQKYFNSDITKPLKDVINKYVYFAENDVIMAKITPCFENGKIGIAKNLSNKIGFGSSEYIVFRPEDRVNNEFLYYFLNRDSYRKLGAQNMKGAVGHKRVAKEFIENTIISFPTDIEEQQKIVQQLDELQEQTKKLEKIYEQKLKDLDELKQSLLQKAFNGEL